ncbi:MAG: class I SAM-dependent methyltransferase [Pseudomonadota bacterium]
MSLQKKVPWWMIVGAKIVLARLPLSYAVWKKLGLFVHGDMNRPERASATFLMHAALAGVLHPVDGKARLTQQAGNAFTVLELGPGDSVFTALVAAALGASESWLVDAGAFATNDPAAYASMLDYLREQGMPMPQAPAEHTMAALLRAANAHYLTDGLASLRQIPDASIDFCFSNAVLQHVRKEEFAATLAQLARVLKPGGVSVHRVNLMDHVGGSLNNLRFAEKTWERKLFRESGFYTNRIGHAQMLALFEQAGFSCVLPRVARWDKLPLPRSALAAPFDVLPDDELRVRGFDVVLRLAPGGASQALSA